MSQTEVQLIKDAVIVNADVSNSAAIDISKISGAMPLAGGSFTDDVTFTGASANIVFDKSDNALEFNDDAKATFGTGADTTFTHSGADFAITNTTGNLNILNNSADAVQIRHGSETMIKAISDGAVELYFDNTKRFETLTDGVRITSADDSTGGVRGDFLFQQVDGTTVATFDASASTLKFEDNRKAIFGAGSDLQIFHSGSHSFIKEVGTGQLVLNTNAFRVNNAADSENLLTADENGAVSLFHDDSKKFETTSAGVTVTGSLTATGGSAITLGDNKKIILGTGSDFEIYHSGSHSYISDEGTGSLLVTTNGTGIYLQKGTTETLAKFLTDGAVELNYDDVKKFETLSDGVNVTGTLKVNGSAFTGGKCIKQLASFTQNSFSSTSSTFADVLSFDFTPESSSSLIVFDFTTANTSVGASGGGGATLGIRLLKDSTVLVNSTNATDGAVGNGELDRLSGTRLVRHMEGNDNTNQRTYKVQFRRTDGNQAAVISNGTGIIVREYA